MSVLGETFKVLLGSVRLFCLLIRMWPGLLTLSKKKKWKKKRWWWVWGGGGGRRLGPLTCHDLIDVKRLAKV